MTVSPDAFDAQEMLASLRPWVECESPSYDAAAVNRMMDVAARDFALAGGIVERIPGRGGFGDCVRVRFPHPRMSEPGILFLCHLDTVHPVGTLRTLPFEVRGERCYGPAILDMKGGTFAALRAVRQVWAEGKQGLPVTFLLTSDEEAGTPTTRDLVKAEAQRNRYVLLPERCRPDGGVVIGRSTVARFDLKVTGRPSHALARASAGRSAVREMAHRIIEIEEMTTPEHSFAVGVVHGGQWINCVPILCEAQAMVVASTQAGLDAGIEKLMAQAGERNGATLSVTHTSTRPLWTPNPASLAAYEQVRAIAAGLGMEVGQGVNGGGSDGNFTGELGIATIDGLGLRGDGNHTLEEHIQIASLAERARLMAGLVAQLS